MYDVESMPKRAFESSSCSSGRVSVFIGTYFPMWHWQAVPFRILQEPRNCVSRALIGTEGLDVAAGLRDALPLVGGCES